jgi:hypothetical protein
VAALYCLRSILDQIKFLGAFEYPKPAPCLAPEFDSCTRKSLIHMMIVIERATAEESTVCLGLGS